MKKGMIGFCAAAAVALATAAPASAQVAWDAPLMISPQMPGGFGIYLVDASVPPPRAGGEGLGVMATWRARSTPGVGFRVGVAEGFSETFSGFGGVDISGSLVRASQEFPLNVVWVTGAGLGAGEYLFLSFPLGVSLGRAFETDEVWFNPYIAPRLVLDASMGGRAPNDGLDMRLVVDLGTDIAFSDSWAVRFGASIGDRQGLAIGLAFPTSALAR
jgi:hypothetical protein